MEQSLQDRIRERAYHLWCNSAGQGDDSYFWLRAEQEVLAELASESHVLAPSQDGDAEQAAPAEAAAESEPAAQLEAHAEIEAAAESSSVAPPEAVAEPVIAPVSEAVAPPEASSWGPVRTRTC